MVSRVKIARERSSRIQFKGIKLFPCATMLCVHAHVGIVDIVRLSAGSVSHGIVWGDRN
jgi:hypothetical protein